MTSTPPQTFRLIDGRIKGHAIQYVYGLPEGEHWEVVCRKRKQTRSDAQNRLMWMWHGELSQYSGEENKDRLHAEFKYRFVRPIILAELEGEDGDRIRKVYAMVETDADAVRLMCDTVFSSTMLNVEQFTRALNLYEVWAAKRGCAFSHPEDVYYQAMGKSNADCA